MDTIKIGPLTNELDRMIGDMFQDFLSNKEMPIYTYKKVDSSFELKLSLPGLAKKDVKINFEDNVLTISHDAKEEVSPFIGSFELTYKVPKSIDSEAICASCENGILFVEMPIADSRKVRNIEIS